VEHIREKQATDAFVAGAVGPLGVELAPMGKVSAEEAQEVFAQQIKVLATGVDLIQIETMTSVPEAEAAVRASRSVAPQLPVIVLVTVDDDRNCLDGTRVQLQFGAGDGAGRD